MSLGTIDLMPAVSVSPILLQRHSEDDMGPGVMASALSVISITHYHQIVLMSSLIAHSSSLILNDVSSFLRYIYVLSIRCCLLLDMLYCYIWNKIS